ncbi:PDR/VanB family oxidoreductase [Saccharopolyspora elongata]|uniref:Oxidoreductase n=1 Tax=Saccharopolyspora elongata TaxID=2530387 RepID=A0A4R4Y5B3_9PSEU|nr:PDR/VanB family oxidoreductase [Saccharopolyspora elongata]TDD38804.1 oxidoreductase [Saccharopolyspora elongata]
MATRETEPELDLVVTRRRDEALGVVSLELQRSDGTPLPTWSPGAHIELDLGEGLLRQYSLSSSTRDHKTWRIAVLREEHGRGGSRRIHDNIDEGDILRVRGPRNHFRLKPAVRYLFIAGGIGITPIIPMLAEAEEQGAEWELVYGGRSADSMAFRDDLEKQYPGRVRVFPEADCGLLDLEELLGTPQPGLLVYCCGPAPLLDAVEDKCIAWPDGSLHVERFTAKELEAPVRSEVFEVKLARAGVTVQVPAGKSVLESVEEAGVQAAYSCREGACGTCMTTVLEGTVDHRDSLLDDDERAAHDTMMICVSRAACAKLVLDL